MGQHSKPPTSRRRILLVVAAALLVALTGVGVRAAVVTSDDSPSARAPRPGEESATPRTPAAAEPGTTVEQQPRASRPFPGRPERRTGLRGGSGMASGLGADAGDLADRAQDLVDGDGRTKQPEPSPLSFVVSSFNVLGASHTGARGNKPRFAGWQQRIGAQIRLLESNGVDVVGFQEFEAPQFHGFMRRTGGKWGVYPALSLGRPHTRNSIAWRRDVWRLADYGSIRVPYFRGNIRPNPVILLTHKDTGRQVFVMNTHNPTSNKKRGNNKRWRAEAMRRQLAKIRSLRSAAPDVPVVMTGDFNEKQPAYCRMRRAGLQAANPGGNGPGCAPPQLMGIDWIFGTRDVTFSGYQRQETGGASDHPMIVATARVE